MGMYQPEIETMDRNELEKLQLERLQKQVKNVYENVPMYRERMDKKGTERSCKVAFYNKAGFERLLSV